MSDKQFQLPGDRQFLTRKKTAGAVEVTAGKKSHTVQAQCEKTVLDHDTRKVEATLGHRKVSLWIYQHKGKRVLAWPGGSLELEASDLTEAGAGAGGALKPLKLTMPGKVLAVKVKAGDVVETGTPLVVVEAMKMENVLLAQARAKVSQVHVQAGDRLESGTVLVSFAPLE